MSRYSKMTYRKLLDDHERQMSNLESLVPLLKRMGMDFAEQILSDAQDYVDELHERLEKQAKRWLKDG